MIQVDFPKLVSLDNHTWQECNEQSWANKCIPGDLQGIQPPKAISGFTIRPTNLTNQDSTVHAISKNLSDLFKHLMEPGTQIPPEFHDALQSVLSVLNVAIPKRIYALNPLVLNPLMEAGAKTSPKIQEALQSALNSALYDAIQTGQSYDLVPLLKAGAKITLTPEIQDALQAALKDAINKKQTFPIKYLIEAGAKITQKVRDAFQASLKDAILKKQIYSIQLLIEAGAKITPEIQVAFQSALLDAICKRETCDFERLIKAGTEINSEIRDAFQAALKDAIPSANVIFIT